MPVRHGRFLESLETGTQGSRIVASGEGADTVRAEDWHEEMEFALVNNLLRGSMRERELTEMPLEETVTRRGTGCGEVAF